MFLREECENKQQEGRRPLPAIRPSWRKRIQWSKNGLKATLLMPRSAHQVAQEPERRSQASSLMTITKSVNDYHENV